HRNVIGVHMLGSYSSEIIWGAAAMVEGELRVTDAREIIFPHPTVSEIIRETLWEFGDK
ncbi:MAG: dihydrolipoyl dehydrogenase, partial [Clostridiales bacterium]|nr:dihydrolipoyl dehydrogenase [Clostridiales bacterium]